MNHALYISGCITSLLFFSVVGACCQALFSKQPRMLQLVFTKYRRHEKRRHISHGEKTSHTVQGIPLNRGPPRPSFPRHPHNANILTNSFLRHVVSSALEQSTGECKQANTHRGRYTYSHPPRSTRPHKTLTRSAEYVKGLRDGNENTCAGRRARGCKEAWLRGSQRSTRPEVMQRVARKASCPSGSTQPTDAAGSISPVIRKGQHKSPSINSQKDLGTLYSASAVSALTILGINQLQKKTGFWNIAEPQRIIM